MHIDIGAISLDLQNFRHKPVTSESEALRLMLEDERNHKVSAIAADIVEQGGLDPSSLLIVTERDGAEDQYIALEGNRRITAMKALATPDLTQGLPTHALFKKLSPKFLALKITSVDCVILDRAKASVWIKRKHYKGMGGKGVMPWNAVATARSDASEGQYTKWMTALAFLEEHNVNAEEIRDRIEAKTTSVERVLASSAMMSVLGLNMAKAGRVEAENSDEASAVTLLEMLMESMASINFKEPLAGC